MSAYPPTTRRILAEPLLTPAECAALRDVIDRAPFEPATVARVSDDAPSEDPVRRCLVAPLPLPALATRLEHTVLALSQSWFQYALDGAHADDPFALMRYQPGHRFDWHDDIGPEHLPSHSRKLSFSLQLSEPASYAGGDLELAIHALPMGSQRDVIAPRLRAQGMLVVFPSFQLHRVTLVTAGTRDAIVGWIHGPPYR